MLFNGSRRWLPLAVMVGVTLTGVSALPNGSPASQARGTVQPELKLLQRNAADRLSLDDVLKHPFIAPHIVQ